MEQDFISDLNREQPTKRKNAKQFVSAKGEDSRFYIYIVQNRRKPCVLKLHIYIYFCRSTNSLQGIENPQRLGFFLYLFAGCTVSLSPRLAKFEFQSKR